MQRSPSPPHHSADDRSTTSQQHLTNIDTESQIPEDDGQNAFSALDDAVDSHSYVTPSLRPSSSAHFTHAQSHQLTNGHLDDDDSDIENDVKQNEDDSVNVSDIESDVQRNSAALENGDVDSEDSGSGRRISAFRPATPKPGLIRRSQVQNHDDDEDGRSQLKDSVIGNDDPAFNQTMIF